MKTLVIGLGNPLLTDDSVGLQVVRALRPVVGDRRDVTVEEDYWGGMRLMEHMIGYDRGIVVDAIRTGATPGTVYRLTPEDLPTEHSASSHDTSLSTALALGRRTGIPLPAPGDVVLIGIEAADVTTFGESCTPEVSSAIPRAVSAVLETMDEGGEEDDLS